jgi:hypothetical protein
MNVTRLALLARLHLPLAMRGNIYFGCLAARSSCARAGLCDLGRNSVSKSVLQDASGQTIGGVWCSPIPSTAQLCFIFCCKSRLDDLVSLRNGKLSGSKGGWCFSGNFFSFLGDGACIAVGTLREG